MEAAAKGASFMMIGTKERFGWSFPLLEYYFDICRIRVFLDLVWSENV